MADEIRPHSVWRQKSCGTLWSVVHVALNAGTWEEEVMVSDGSLSFVMAKPVFLKEYAPAPDA